MMAGLYIHIPFCKSRCIYCGFYSTTLSDMCGAYVDALCLEMDARKGELREPLQSIYLGGGTPSQLSSDLLKQLFGHIESVFGGRFAHDVEITMECNPDDVDDEFCLALQSLPVNRVSMGVQTFDDSRLRFLHRRHSAKEARAAVGRLRNAGIDNISIDLMFGFPEETLADWERDLTEALSLDVEHLSAYSLMYEESTPLYGLLRQGKVKEMDEELYRQMYDALIGGLTSAGYEHYEISNFARPGKRSRHNSNYWRGVGYIGLGAAAHSYDGATRSWNVADVKQYIGGAKQVFNSIRTVEKLDERERYNDLIVTALRTREGIDMAVLPTAQSDYLLQQARPYLSSGCLQEIDNHLALTRQGIYISDTIMVDLIM